MINSTDNQQYTGDWWLPHNIEMKIPGILTYSKNEGIVLDLYGNFDEKDTMDPFGIIILGESSYGEEITVFQAFVSGSKKPFSEVHKGTSSFIANKAYIGCHFQSKEDVKFIKIAYHPTYLDDWLDLKPTNIEYKENGFSLSYTKPDRLVFPIGDDLKIHIGYTANYPDFGSSNHMHFEHKSYFIIERNKEEDFNSFGKIMYLLNSFLALAVMCPIYPLDVEGYSYIKNKQVDKATISPPIKILLPLHNKDIQGRIFFFDMLFPYSKVSQKLGILLKNWFEKSELLEPVYDLFFSVLLSTQSYPIQTFLSYSQALETYHRRTRSNNIDAPEIHRNKLNEIINSVSEEHREWLRGQLSFSNEPSFSQRLKEIIDFNPRIVSGMVGSHDVFIKKIKDTRNYYTHYDPKSKGKAAVGGELKGLSIILGSMLECILLYEMGFELVELNDIQSHRRRLPNIWY